MPAMKAVKASQLMPASSCLLMMCTMTVALFAGLPQNWTTPILWFLCRVFLVLPGIMTCALLIGLLLAYVIALLCLVGFVILGVPHITTMLWHSIKSIAIRENHKTDILMCDEGCEAPLDALTASKTAYKQLLKV